MEDVLDVYKRPYDAQQPVVCLDEASKQLVAEVNAPLPPEPGQPERADYEYERRGTANVFMVFEPLAGQRRVEVTARRTAVDFSKVVWRFVGGGFSPGDRGFFVVGNFKTDWPGSPF